MLELRESESHEEDLDTKCSNCGKLDRSLDSNPVSNDNFDLELGDIKLESSTAADRR